MKGDYVRFSKKSNFDKMGRQQPVPKVNTSLSILLDVVKRNSQAGPTGVTKRKREDPKLTAFKKDVFDFGKKISSSFHVTDSISWKCLDWK